MGPLVQRNLVGERHDRWWRDAVLYQIYPKSFADASGDGVGDIAGMAAHLDYVKGLGVDAVWVSPWYASPMKDGGYDVRDYQHVDPVFGTNDDAKAFIAGCHDRGLGVVLDIVANHCSVEHPWFQAALAAPAGSPAREWFYFRDGRGDDGDEPPTDWISVFGGSAWTRESQAGGGAGQWYLNIFDSSQPDLNWGNPAVADMFDAILTFWFDLGVDGFRLDAIPAIGKDGDFADCGFGPDARWTAETWPPMPFWDADGVHEVMRRWRRLADGYRPSKFLVGEVLVGSHERLARYVRPGELQSVFSIGISMVPWEAAALSSFVTSMAGAIPVGSSWLTWTLSSHDEVRTVSRYAPRDPVTGERDLDLGRSRSRALHMLLLALPGAACLYQGEELGLDQVDDIPVAQLQDPIYVRTGDPERSRDGCRVPLPWTSEGPTLGFSATGASWLPQPERWRTQSVSAQEGDATSFLSFIRSIVGVRHEIVGGLGDDVTCVAEGSVVTLRRGGGFTCVVNMGERAVPLEAEGIVLVTSWDGPPGTEIAPNSAVWMMRPGGVETA